MCNPEARDNAKDVLVCRAGTSSVHGSRNTRDMTSWAAGTRSSHWSTGTDTGWWASTGVTAASPSRATWSNTSTTARRHDDSNVGADGKLANSHDATCARCWALYTAPMCFAAADDAATDADASSITCNSAANVLASDDDRVVRDASTDATPTDATWAASKTSDAAEAREVGARRR